LHPTRHGQVGQQQATGVEVIAESRSAWMARDRTRQKRDSPIAGADGHAILLDGRALIGS